MRLTEQIDPNAGSAAPQPLSDRRLGPVVSPTLVETVLRELRASILSGQFAPGERLIEAKLARDLGISRGPIREALALLEKDGIVVKIPRRGKFVQGFDRRAVDEVYSLRKVLERYAVELLISSMTRDTQAALERSLDLIRQAADAADVLSLAERDIAFHNELYELAEHELLKRAWADNISGKLRMLLNITTRTHIPLSDAAANHQAIVEAVLDRNVRLARSLVSKHIDDAWHRASKALTEAGLLGT